MGEKKESEALNLWSSLLKESSKRVKATDATCIILGDHDSGKSTLLSKLGGESILGAEVNSSILKEILSYTFIDVDEEFLDSDSVSRINLWSISDKTFTGCIENVIKPGESERMLFMVAVDISKPDSCLESLKKWLRHIKKFANQRYQDISGGNNNAPDVKWSDLGLPIIIVVCKSDLVKVEDAVTLKKAKFIQGQLRAIGLLIGAAVVYTSAVTDINTVRLKQYIISKLYSQIINLETNIEDGMNTAFIPQGSDSPELIHISTGLLVSPLGTETMAILDSPLLIGSENGDVEEKTGMVSESLAGLELEDEEEWLGGLQSYISEVTATSVTSQPTIPVIPGVLTAVATPVADGSLETVKSVPGATRRSFRAPVAPQGKEDVGDFFKNLLAGAGTSAKK